MELIDLPQSEDESDCPQLLGMISPDLRRSVSSFYQRFIIMKCLVIIEAQIGVFWISAALARIILHSNRPGGVW